MLPFTGLPRVDRAYNLSFVVLMIGLVTAIADESGESMAVSRAGAIIVMISILLIFNSIDRWTQNDSLYSRPFMGSPTALAALSDEEGPDCDVIAERQKEEDDLEMYEMKKNKALALTVSKHEKVLLLSGTFIWGFGDLFPKVVAIV